MILWGVVTAAAVPVRIEPDDPLETFAVERWTLPLQGVPLVQWTDTGQVLIPQRDLLVVDPRSGAAVRWPTPPGITTGLAGDLLIRRPHGELVAVDWTSGQVQWRTTFISDVTVHRTARWGDTVYVVVDYESLDRQEIVAFGARNGEMRWSKTCDGRGADTTILADDERIYRINQDVQALNPVNARSLWTWARAEKPVTDMGPMAASLFPGGLLLPDSGSKGAVVLDGETGQVVRRFAPTADSEVLRAERVGDRVVLLSRSAFGPQVSRLTAFDAASGAELWHWATPGPLQWKAATDSRILVTGATWLHLFDAEDGRIVGETRVADTWGTWARPIGDRDVLVQWTGEPGFALTRLTLEPPESAGWWEEPATCPPR